MATHANCYFSWKISLQLLFVREMLVFARLYTRKTIGIAGFLQTFVLIL